MKQYPDDPTIKEDLRIAKAKVESGSDRCGPSKLPKIPRHHWCCKSLNLRRHIIRVSPAHKQVFFES
jgi:hypothetical protein